MAQYIPKAALVAEIARQKAQWRICKSSEAKYRREMLDDISSFLDTLEVKEVDEQKERMNECPYRQVGCTMYEGKVLECNGACSWVVDYPKLNELKARKGE